MTVSRHRHSEKLISVVDENIAVRLCYFNLKEIKYGGLAEEFEIALRNGNVSIEDLESRNIVFDNMYEGHGARELRAVIDSLSQYSWFSPDRAMFRHNTFDELPIGVNAIARPAYMVEHAGWFQHHDNLTINWDDLNRDRLFICLMRRRSRERSILAREIRSKFSPDDYYLSYASMINYTAWDDDAQCQIPILLDGTTFGEEQHRATDLRFFSPLINLIVETSSQVDENTWRSLFVTEKTFKCFAWHQLPIWWALPGLVKNIRTFGFDMFDDLLDNHRYDDIQDPVSRMDAMLSTLSQLMQHIKAMGVDAVNMRLMPRFQYNYVRLKTMVKEKYAG
jgi:hypothetical protein